MTTLNAPELRQRIVDEYQIRGDTRGWRFLYSPEAVLNGARTAFIGLNPGGYGSEEDLAGPDFVTAAGTSAYSAESWAGRPPGKQKLQREVLELFKMIGVRPHEVLAGNLVPFRSPNWDQLANQQSALSFGMTLWTEILTSIRPTLVVAMGQLASTALQEMLNVQNMREVDLAWGSIRGRHGSCDFGRFVGLPHLSRFSVITRTASQPGIASLLGLR